MGNCALVCRLFSKSLRGGYQKESLVRRVTSPTTSNITATTNLLWYITRGNNKIAKDVVLKPTFSIASEDYHDVGKTTLAVLPVNDSIKITPTSLKLAFSANPGCGVQLATRFAEMKYRKNLFCFLGCRPKHGLTQRTHIHLSFFS